MLSGDFGFAVALSGTDDREGGRAVGGDAEGNVYIAGELSETIDFDPTDSKFELSPATFGGFFLAKYSPAGEFIWARSLGGGGFFDPVIDIAVSPDGSVYATGPYHNGWGPVDFDPGEGVYQLPDSQTIASFVCKLDANGNFLWAHGFGGAGQKPDRGTAIALGSDGSVVTAGLFSGTADFDPGPGTWELTSDDCHDVFISKFDADGNFLWAGGVGSVSHYADVAVGPDGSVYATGSFMRTADFDPGPEDFWLTAEGDRDVFVSKLDAAGNLVWARSMGGSEGDYGRGISVGPNGSAYLNGTFRETVDFDPGPGTFALTSAGESDVFLCKLDAAGEFHWARSLGDEESDDVDGIGVDPHGCVYTAGNFRGTWDFDPGPNVFEVTAASSADAYISKFDAAADFVHVWILGGPDWVGIGDLALAPDGSLLTTGAFGGTADFDPSQDTFELEGKDEREIFICKLLPALPAAVVARHVFYNNSAFDGRDPAANAEDDGAVALDKVALLLGGTASLANYTSYARGINGVMVDLGGLPEGVVPEVGDFAFRVGNGNDPAAWADAPEPSSVTLRAGAGLDGSVRATIVWPDYAIGKQWLEVTVRAERLGLPEDDVFYFGNAVAEAGNSTLAADVTTTDLLLARNNPHSFLDPATVVMPYDYNRDARVNATDVLLARNNQTNLFTALKLIDLTGDEEE